VIAVSQCA
jgi:hypothetical protein